MTYIPPDCPWDNGFIESFNNRLRKECGFSRSVRADFDDGPPWSMPPRSYGSANSLDQAPS